MEIVYRAKDGRIFETEARCLEHESQAAVEYFFSKESITTAPRFRYAITQFKDYVKSVLDSHSPDPVPPEEAEIGKPIPAFVPVFSEEKERERERATAKLVLEDYLESYNIEDIRDLNNFFADHGEALATYFGFRL